MSPITSTRHTLPFDKLSAFDFERMCYWLVKRAGFERVEHLGASGGEQGRDIIAWREGKRFAFQCKRVLRFGPRDAENEASKLHGLPLRARPDCIVFLVTCGMSAKARQRARGAWGDDGSCHFWVGSELDEMIKRHRDLVKEFFGGALDNTVPAPRQVPSPPADFAGRRAEILTLRRAATRGARIVAVRGAGGIGKTVLALKFAQSLSRSHPDGQFYLDLRGAHEQPALSPQEVMRRVIRGWRPTGNLPDDDVELLAMYRTILHGKRALLFFDNARDARQVQPLVPPDGNFLLITSRQHFVLPGLSALNLDVLKPKDALALLLSICPRLDAKATDLARLCGHYGLALRVSASTLATREDISPEMYLARLEKTREYLDQGAPDYERSCTASISLTYELLSEELKQRWRVLAVFDGSFKLGAAASIWGIAETQALEDLGRLLDHSLVECYPGSHRYHLHDLTQQVANERLGPE